MSWLVYGLPMRFWHTPRRMAFPDHPSCRLEEDFLDAEVKEGLEEGCFDEVDPSVAMCINPQHVEVGDNGKRRRCDDQRYPNSFLAHTDFCIEKWHR